MMSHPTTTLQPRHLATKQRIQAMTRRDIEFKASDGTILRGWFYPPPKDSGKAPCIILTHGVDSENPAKLILQWTCVKEMSLDIFAEYFTAHLPIGAIAYDNRNLGASDGQPRGELIPYLQQSDMQDAITYAQSLDQVDPQKIAIWGSSYSGGNVLQVGAIDRRVKAVLAQNTFSNGWETFKRNAHTGLIPQMEQMFAADRAARMRGETPVYLPVVSNDPAIPASLPGAAAYDYFTQGHENAPSWVNQVTLKSVEVGRAFNPEYFVPFIAPTPLLLTVTANDSLTPTDIQLEVYSAAREPKQLQLLPGDHFVAYGGLLFEKNAATQAEFLKKWLL